MSPLRGNYNYALTVLLTTAAAWRLYGVQGISLQGDEVALDTTPRTA